MREIINQSAIKTIIKSISRIQKKRIEREINGNYYDGIKRFVSFNLSRFINIDSHCITFKSQNLFSRIN